MTEQYGQDGINLQYATPIAISTPDATPVDVYLGAMSVDGQSLTFDIYGGGSDPDDVATNNYVVQMRANFTRAAGTVAPGAANIVIDTAGAGPAFTFVAVGDECFLRITGPASVYSHRLRAIAFEY